MKKIFLLTTLLPVALHTLISQSQGLPPLPWQTDDPSLIYRVQGLNEFPILLADSVHCGNYEYNSPYQLTQETYNLVY